MKACAGKGTGSLLKAYKELRQYTQLPEPAADLVKVSSQWRSYSDVSGGEDGDGSPSVLPDEAQDEEEKHAQPVRPDEIREKFNMTEGDMLAVLAWLFDTDPKFREGVGLDGHLQSLGLEQEGGDAHRCGAHGLDVGLEALHGVAGVDDVLDYDHVTSGYILGEAHDLLYRAGR